ncbi:Thiamine-phosphate synthase [compost metagenome]
MLDSIHYISQGSTIAEQLTSIRGALEGGCKLIQLRFKNVDEASFLEVGKQAREWCTEFNAIFIVNDYVHLAKQLQADGVHLGLTDTRIEEARAILGPDAIIGGTANTLEDVLQRIDEKCDYVGLGPFRFTTTKEKLSPILGIDGYRSILTELTDRHVSIPVYAIGGITLGDVEELMKTGIYGIAVSGIITTAPDKKEIVDALHQKSGNYVTNR